MNKTNGGAPPETYPLTWVQDAELKLNQRALVKGLIDTGSFTVIYGPSGSGKSFFTADLAQHIATGAPWRGHQTQQSFVAYVASEAGASILKRFVAWRENRLGESSGHVPLAILTRGPNLLEEAEQKALIVQLIDAEQECGYKLRKVVFDTLSRSIPGGDENSAQDMTRAVQAADLIRDTTGAATTYVHHSGKDVAKGARGHSALFAAADVVLRIESRCATLEKVRDGVSGERFPFALEPVEIGTDADGDPVMSCLLYPADTSAAPVIRSAPLKGSRALGLQTLKEAISELGARMPGTSTIPAGVRAVTLQEWRARFGLRYGSDDKTPVRQAFYRAREHLIESSIIAISDPYVWCQ